MIKKILFSLVFGLFIGLLVCGLLVLSPLFMVIDILAFAVRLEDAKRIDIERTIYVSEKGIEWENVRP